jgi:hypothetical protein
VRAAMSSLSTRRKLQQKASRIGATLRLLCCPVWTKHPHIQQVME